MMNTEHPQPDSDDSIVPKPRIADLDLLSQRDALVDAGVPEADVEQIYEHGFEKIRNTLDPEGDRFSHAELQAITGANLARFRREWVERSDVLDEYTAWEWYEIEMSFYSESAAENDVQLARKFLVDVDGEADTGASADPVKA